MGALWFGFWAYVGYAFAAVFLPIVIALGIILLCVMIYWMVQIYNLAAHLMIKLKKELGHE